MFPASISNQITYAYFCTLGGLSNKNTCKVLKKNGKNIYHTYHLTSTN